jgi:probable phosphoglycerate mutase
MFVIVRHGNTFESGEPPRRIGARTDLPLTAKGRAQGAALGAHFAARGWAFARVLVSPLRRTRETAQAIADHLPGTPAAQPCDWLREIDHGPDENATEDAVLARIGAQALADWDERGCPVRVGGRCARAVGRVAQAVRGASPCRRAGFAGDQQWCGAVCVAGGGAGGAGGDEAADGWVWRDRAGTGWLAAGLLGERP